MALADRANEYVDAKKPWKLNKDPAARQSCKTSARSRSTCIRQTRRLPLRRCCRSWPSRAGELLDDPIAHWDESQAPLVGTPIATFEHLMKRVDPKKASKP